jgi:hypothetical protein
MLRPEDLIAALRAASAEQRAEIRTLLSLTADVNKLAVDVNKVRELGMLSERPLTMCKKALVQTEGDMEKALLIVQASTMTGLLT